MRAWARAPLLLIAILSGACALGLLLLPVLLVMLMVLFDSTAHAVMLLLGLVANWFQQLVPGGGGLPGYRPVSIDPLRVALSASARALPCLAGLVLLLAVRPRPWRVIAALWAASCLLGGVAAAILLAPGLAASALFALRPTQDSVPKRGPVAERDVERRQHQRQP